MDCGDSPVEDDLAPHIFPTAAQPPWAPIPNSLFHYGLR